MFFKREMTSMQLVLSLVLLIVGVAYAGAQSVTPPQGSGFCKELLDTVRPVFEKETEGPVEFVVHRLNVMNGWSFGDVFLQRPGGRRIDWSRTKYAEDEKNGDIRSRRLFLSAEAVRFELDRRGICNGTDRCRVGFLGARTIICPANCSNENGVNQLIVRAANAGIIDAPVFDYKRILVRTNVWLIDAGPAARTVQHFRTIAALPYNKRIKVCCLS